jgi:hypothetical protein
VRDHDVLRVEAATKIPANFAQGFRRRGKPAGPFMNMAEGSLEMPLLLDFSPRSWLWRDRRPQNILEEASRMRTAYAAAILTPDFHILEGYQGR